MPNETREDVTFLGGSIEKIPLCVKEKNHKIDTRSEELQMITLKRPGT